MMTKPPKPPKRQPRGKRPAPSSRFEGGNRPHNARSSPPVASVEELVRRIANEPRQAVVGGRTVTMTLAERRLRSEIEAALKGGALAIERLVKLMIKHPQLIRNRRRHISINLSEALYNV